MEKEQKRILIVEDEKYLIDLYTEILQTEYHIDQAMDGEIAFEKMHAGGYDLVLLDIMLPKMDGVKILEKLQKEPPQTPNKNVVILTNVEQSQIIADTTSMGIRGYLVKTDITPDVLLKEVKNYLL